MCLVIHPSLQCEGWDLQVTNSNGSNHDFLVCSPTHSWRVWMLKCAEVDPMQWVWHVLLLMLCSTVNHGSCFSWMVGWIMLMCCSGTPVCLNGSSLSSSALTLVVLGVSPEDPVQVEVDALDLIGRRLVGTSSGSREWQARRISRRIRCKMAWRIPSNTWWMIVRRIPGSQYWMIGWSIAWRFIENISWRIQWTI